MVKGGVTTSYAYGADGLRTQKQYGSTTYNYYYVDGRLVRMTWANSYIDFLYDESGSIYSFVYNGNQYYYIKNLQGDVIQIRSVYGTVLVEYDYDAWGNCTIAYAHSSYGDLATLNPIRYRGYVYDFETGFYYLNSRYYDPQVKRFINADDASLLGANGDFTSLNLYSYCGNNPISRSDNGGAFWNIVIGAVVGGLISAVTTAIDSYSTTGSVDWGKVGISAAVGAISGGIAATGLGTIAQAAISAVASAAGSIVTDLYEKSNSTESAQLTWEETGEIALRAIGSAAIGFGSSVFGTAAGKIVSNGLETQGASMIFRGKIGAECFTKAQARTLVNQGKTIVNTARGISSVVGTIFTWPISTALSISMS